MWGSEGGFRRGKGKEGGGSGGSQDLSVDGLIKSSRGLNVVRRWRKRRKGDRGGGEGVAGTLISGIMGNGERSVIVIT